MNDEKLAKDLHEFKKELIYLINKYSLERTCNTPDFILADYLMQSLFNFAIISNYKENWYGKSLRIGEDK